MIDMLEVKFLKNSQTYNNFLLRSKNDSNFTSLFKGSVIIYDGKNTYVRENKLFSSYSDSSDFFTIMYFNDFLKIKYNPNKFIYGHNFYNRTKKTEFNQVFNIENIRFYFLNDLELLKNIIYSKFQINILLSDVIFSHIDIGVNIYIHKSNDIEKTFKNIYLSGSYSRSPIKVYNSTSLGINKDSVYYKIYYKNAEARVKQKDEYYNNLQLFENYHVIRFEGHFLPTLINKYILKKTYPDKYMHFRVFKIIDKKFTDYVLKAGNYVLKNNHSVFLSYYNKLIKERVNITKFNYDIIHKNFLFIQRELRKNLLELDMDLDLYIKFMLRDFNNFYYKYTAPQKVESIELNSSEKMYYKVYKKNQNKLKNMLPKTTYYRYIKKFKLINSQNLKLFNFDKINDNYYPELLNYKTEIRVQSLFYVIN